MNVSCILFITSLCKGFSQFWGCTEKKIWGVPPPILSCVRHWPKSSEGGGGSKMRSGRTECLTHQRLQGEKDYTHVRLLKLGVCHMEGNLLFTLIFEKVFGNIRDLLSTFSWLDMETVENRLLMVSILCNINIMEYYRSRCWSKHEYGHSNKCSKLRHLFFEESPSDALLRW
jgi:hypothetical protein